MSYFSGVQSASSTDEAQALEKALSAGYGTDSATYINGRAMIQEDLEASAVNVVAQLKEDCKVFNSLKTTPCKSTVHEFNRRTDHGNYRFLSVPEGGESAETDQELERAFVEMKYLQTRRSVTKQMETVNTFEGALASEKLAGIETIIKGAEHQIFHGDSSVVPTEFDGFLSMFNKEDTKAAVQDLRGKTIGSVGETLFDDIAQMVFDRGGDLNKALFPSVLARDVKGLFTDRLRMMMNDTRASFAGLPDYDTAIGSNIRFSGANAGADKFYRVKGKVKAEGNPEKRPAPPTSVVAKASDVAGSSFETNDAGNYNYTVHAVNAFGISEGTPISAPVAVAGGNGVTLTITPASTGKAATGFIICRSKKDGTEVMEMTQIGKGTGATTTFVDTNKDLPGTASMIFLSEGRTSPIITFDQLLPVSSIPLFPTASAETPFLVVMYGALQVSAPQFCGFVKNIAYNGGF